MQSWIRRALAGVLGGALVVGGVAGCAGHRDRGHEGNAESFRARMVERVGQKLELDAAQKQKLDVLSSKLQAQRQVMRGAGSGAGGEASDPRAQFRALFAGAWLDQAGANQLLDAKLNALRAGGPEVIAAAADFYDHLNPAQQQKVRDFMERGGRRWGRHG